MACFTEGIEGARSVADSTAKDEFSEAALPGVD